MNPQPIGPEFGPDFELIFEFDESNGQVDYTRRPLPENRRKAIQERLERAEQLMRVWKEGQKANPNGQE